MSAKSYIVKKINELPTFTGALSPDDLVAFYDISTGITHKIKVSEIGGGSLDHRDLTQESRFANDQHVMGSVVGLVDKIADLDSEDINLQQQIFEIIENNPIDIVRFFTRNQIVLSGQTVYLSSETKGTNAALNITQNVTGTDRATANVIAKFAGDTPLTVERELPAQNTSLFLRLNKNKTNRNVFIFVEFYDYDAGGVLTLKGTTSDFEIRSDVDVYNVLLQIEAYIAQIGARSWIEIKSYQTGSGVAAQTTLGIEGDYYSRFQYRIPTGALSFLDEKVTSTQDLPPIGALAGESQKDVNLKSSTKIGEVDTRLTTIESDAVRVSGIDMSDVNVGEKKILVAEKGSDGLPQFGGAIGLLDVLAPPTLDTLLDESNSLWIGDYIMLTGDNRQGQLGENSQFFEKNGDLFLCKTHDKGTTALNGSATWARNRGQDCLKPESIALHATIVGQLETEAGWNTLAQFKQITAESKRGSWFRRLTGGYLYMCIDDENGWTRVGTPPTIELEITTASHPNLTTSLAAHDFTANRFYVEGTNATDEPAEQGQEWWDTSNKYVYRRNMNGNWAKLN